MPGSEPRTVATVEPGGRIRRLTVDGHDVSHVVLNADIILRMLEPAQMSATFYIDKIVIEGDGDGDGAHA
jgi:hypothetical protein